MLVPKSPLLQPSDPEALLNTKNRNQPSPPLSLPSSKALTSSPTQCSPPLCSAPPPAAPRCSAPPPSDPRPSLPARPLLSLALSASLLPDGLSTPRRPLRSSLPGEARPLSSDHAMHGKGEELRGFALPGREFQYARQGRWRGKNKRRAGGNKRQPTRKRWQFRYFNRTLASVHLPLLGIYASAGTDTWSRFEKEFDAVQDVFELQVRPHHTHPSYDFRPPKLTSS